MQTNPGETMSGADLLATLTHYRWLVSGVVIMFVLVSVLVAFLLPKVYRAEVVLMPVSQDASMAGSAILAGQLGGLASLAGINLGEGGQKDEVIAIMRSRKFTGDFISDLDLIPVLFHKDWDEESQQWDIRNEERIPTLWDAIEEFDENIRSISENRQTGIVTLSIDWIDPVRAAKWANTIVERTNQIMREKVIQESEKSIEFLSRELESTNIVEIRQGIFDLMEHHTQKKMLANVQEEYAFKIIDPAVPPDADHYVSPRRLLLLVLGLILGVITGVFLALLARLVQQDNPEVSVC